MILLAPGLPAQTVVTLETQKVPVTPNREDVKAIGMGRTQIANGKMWNGMMYNPALLARTRTAIDGLGVQASLPLNSFEAAAFLRDNASEFQSGGFIKTINSGVRAFQNAGTPEQRSAAIRQINSGLSFINQLQEKVLGPSDNPRIQGVSASAAVQVQLGNFGFSLHTTVQEAFQVFAGDALSRLYALRLPEDVDNLTLDQQLALLDILSPLLDPVTFELKFQQAIPQTFALGYFDIVGTAGYGYQITPDLSVGANLKIVNRRISTRVIASDNYENILSELRKDFETSVTGFTIDLGGLYRLKSTGTEFGLSVQNVIPMPKTEGIARLNSIIYDANLVPQPVEIRLPIDFVSPLLVNIGATHPITPHWEASFDWVDIASQDTKHASYMSRFRFGTEYRLDAIEQVLGIAFRGGVTDRKLAAGLGLNLFRVLQLDGAYARDNFVDDNAVFVQLRLGW